MNLRRPRTRRASAPPTVYVGDYTHKLTRIRPLAHDEDERQCREDRDYGKRLFSDLPLPRFLTGAGKPRSGHHTSPSRQSQVSSPSRSSGTAPAST